MSAHRTEGADPWAVIRPGGGAAAVREDGEIEATLARHDEWVRAGRPGARTHEDVMAELLGP